MSLFLPFHRGVQRSQSWAEARLASTIGTLVTAAGSSHALGTKVELFSATTHDAHWIHIMFGDTFGSNTRTDQLVNIYIGANGSEQVLIPNLLAGWAGHITTAPGYRGYWFPLFIPAGSRIAAANQALIASDTVRVLVELFGGGEPLGWTGRGVECVGADTANSIGVSVTAGGASEGSFTDIGTTAKEWRYILPMAQGTLADTATGTTAMAMDIGVGGAVYKDLKEFWNLRTTNETSAPADGGMGRFAVIPAGTALQLRGQDAFTAEAMDCCIYGVY
jgi:hypothetical protein